MACTVIQKKNELKNCSLNRFSFEKQERKQDYESYVTSLLLPIQSRRSFYAIRALNIEIANVKEVVSKSTFGTFRIQWWKESVLDLWKVKKQILEDTNQSQKEYNIPNPVLSELLRAITVHNLSKTWFIKMFDRRVLKEKIFLHLLSFWKPKTKK